jgi:uncharacterized membrane protein
MLPFAAEPCQDQRTVQLTRERAGQRFESAIRLFAFTPYANGPRSRTRILRPVDGNVGKPGFQRTVGQLLLEGRKSLSRNTLLEGSAPTSRYFSRGKRLRMIRDRIDPLFHRQGFGYNLRAMEELLIITVGYLRLTVEAIGAAVVGLGAIATAFRYVLTLLGLKKYSNADLRLFLGRYLVLGLEFQLGADILSTAVAPTWEEVQLLAAIVVIRTVLNYFLQKELERERGQATPEPEREALHG